MCFPTRRTPAMRARSSVAWISAAGDLSGSGFEPSQTDSMRSPRTRSASPRAMVSTSGSSGMDSTVYRKTKSPEAPISRLAPDASSRYDE